MTVVAFGKPLAFSHRSRPGPHATGLRLVRLRLSSLSPGTWTALKEAEDMKKSEDKLLGFPRSVVFTDPRHFPRLLHSTRPDWPTRPNSATEMGLEESIMG